MIARPVVVYAKERVPEVIEIVSVYDELGHRGTATISHVGITFSIEVSLNGNITKVDNWRTAKYDFGDISAVSEEIYCVGQYYPPKYIKHRITRKIF